MIFKYEGFNNVGQAKKGEIEAHDEGKAAELLREQGIFAQQLVGQGEVLTTVLPGNDASKKTEMIMPWQEPPQESKIIDPSPPKMKKPASDIGRVAGAANGLEKTIILPAKQWKTNLKHNLDAINEVVAHFDKLNEKKGKKTEIDKRITAAKNAAVDELVGQAIKRAVAEAL